MLTDEDVKSVCEGIVNNLGFYPHQIGSYEYLISDLIPQMIASYSPIYYINEKTGILHLIKITDVRYSRPCVEVTPGDLRPSTGKNLHNEKLSLLTEVRVNLVQETYEVKTCKNKRKKKTQTAPAGDAGDAKPVYGLISRTIFEDFCLMELPLMDGLGLCNDFDKIDPVAHDRYAGTFCVNGHRKCMITQTRMRCNFPFVKASNPNARSTFQCEVRSAHPSKMRSSSTIKLFLMKNKKSCLLSEQKLVCQIAFIPKKAPITILLFLLGLKTYGAMLRAICPNSNMSTKNSDVYALARGVLNRCSGLVVIAESGSCEERVLEWVSRDLNGAKATGSVTTLGTRSSKMHAQSMRNLLSSEVLPHLGSEWIPSVLKKKAAYVAQAVRKLLLVAAGEQRQDDVDETEHQRFSATGKLIAMKIRQLLRQAVMMMKATMVRCCEHNKPVCAIDLIKVDTISRPLRSCIARGNFACSKSQTSSQNGVCQVLNSMNRLSRIAHMTVINKPVSRDGSHSDARQLKPSAWGMICAAHTPDGRSIGLVTHHTLFFDIRRGHPNKKLCEIILSLRKVHSLLETEDREYGVNPTIINIDSNAVGWTRHPGSVFKTLARLRQHFVLPKDVSFSYDKQIGTITIHAEEGDGLRPILVTKNLFKVREIVQRYGRTMVHLVYRQLLSEGVLIHVNKSEESGYLVAHSRDMRDEKGCWGDFTHVEIDPTTGILGATIGIVPFLNCNQGPRNVYFGAMAPQSIGAEHPMAQRYHVDMLYYTLMYPQKPLTRTLTSHLVEGDSCDESIYQLYNVAVLPASGKNEEDAIVMNRSSIQRGLGISMKYTIIRDNETEFSSGDIERFMFPPLRDSQDVAVAGRKNGSYHALDEKTGLPKKGATVSPGDVVIGKVFSVKMYARNSAFVTRMIDKSTVWRGSTPGVISAITLFSRRGKLNVLVRVAEIHHLETGDKLASISAQKGVVSDTLNQEDMPFNEQGIVPDMLFSPHGITSRMTIGGVREFVSNHIAIKTGKIFDGTAFRCKGVEIVDQETRKGACEHSFICGKTGRPIGRGFMFLVGYTLQRHQVVSKVHARATGPRNAITQQPAEGRSHKGGLKLGSMEISCLASAGAAQSLRDCMTDYDGRKVRVCSKCGRLSGENCFICSEEPLGKKSVDIFIPRVTLALMWELMSCGIVMRLVPGKKK